MSDIESKVRAIVAEKLGIPEEQITQDGNFVEDLGADSLDSVELVMALEEEFGIEIPDDAAEKIHCLRDVMSYLTSKQLMQ